MNGQLPEDIFTEVLSRLPLEKLSKFREISKEWRTYIESVEFTRLYLARSAPMLAVLKYGQKSSCCRIYKLFDRAEDDDDRHYLLQTRSVFPHAAKILGSARGLLLLIKVVDQNQPLHQNLFVWNPLFNYYFNLDHRSVVCDRHITQSTCYGFGVSNVLKSETNVLKYKVVRIIFSINNVPKVRGDINNVPTVRGEVFTLGLEQEEGWREIQPTQGFSYNPNEFGALVNGNLHWLVSNSDKKWRISCFDIDTECFTTFSTPLSIQENKAFHGGVTVLNGRLCLHEIKYSNQSHQTAIWVINNYDAEKEWALQVVLDNDEDFGGFFTSYPLLTCYPLHLFGDDDDDVLMVGDLNILFNYSRQTKTSSEIDIFGRHDCYGIIHSPCYLSLKSTVGVQNPHVTTIEEADIYEDV